MRRPPTAPQPPLLEVLGASWALGASVTGVAWNGLVAGFALGDGSLATARGEWEGAAKLAPVEGGAQLTPASAPAPPMVRQRVHVGACSAVAALPDGGFVTGGADGALVQSAADGVMTELEGDPSRPVELVAAGAGWIAAASGRRVSVSGPGGHRLELPAFATAMAFDDAGSRLAVAHGRGVTLWSAKEGERALQAPGAPVSVAWSPDGAHLVCGLADGALHAWRLAGGSGAGGSEADGSKSDGGTALGSYTGNPGSLSFSGDGQEVASSGGPQVACWRFDAPPGSPPALCSLSNTPFPVCRVAWHPANAIIAVGYGNGAVLLSQPGLDDVLFVKGPTGGAVTALGWSADGACLAMGTAEGEVGVAALPALLFRASAPQASTAEASSAQVSPAQAGTNPQQRSAVA